MHDVHGDKENGDKVKNDILNLIIFNTDTQ
jgi:hypothetical protein